MTNPPELSETIPTSLTMATSAAASAASTALPPAERHLLGGVRGGLVRRSDGQGGHERTLARSDRPWGPPAILAHVKAPGRRTRRILIVVLALLVINVPYVVHQWQLHRVAIRRHPGHRDRGVVGTVR